MTRIRSLVLSEGFKMKVICFNLINILIHKCDIIIFIYEDPGINFQKIVNFNKIEYNYILFINLNKIYIIFLSVNK